VHHGAGNVISIIVKKTFFEHFFINIGSCGEETLLWITIDTVVVLWIVKFHFADFEVVTVTVTVTVRVTVTFERAPRLREFATRVWLAEDAIWRTYVTRRVRSEKIMTSTCQS
jgi:hypothetical protein